MLRRSSARRFITIVASIALTTFALPLAAGIAPASAATAPSPFGWVGPMNVAASPTARAGAAMVYDTATNSVVLFGGDNGSFLGDTWTWNGSTWTHLSPATSPSARTHAAMVYDPNLGKVVLFGGEGATGALGDTWTFNGATWTQAAPATSPSARFAASMTYDGAHGDAVLFGGDTSSGALGDTWTFNGATWTQAAPATSPSARFAASMTYDSINNNVILFGGDGATGALADTWAWNGATWTHLSPATSPSARGWASLAYDAKAGDAVLFGGFNFAGGYDSDTWAWNGATWTAVNSSNNPTARADASMKYVPSRGNLVLFGGGTGSGYFAQTWVYATTPSAPTGVTATLNASAQVVVSWNPPSFDGGSTVTRYAATANDLSKASRGGQVCATSGATSCLIAGLTNGDVYNFSVVATNAIGTSSVSAPSANLPITVVPGAPSGVTATSGQNAQSLVRWTAPVLLGASAITGYVATTTDLTKSSRGGQVCATSGATSCVVAGLTNGDTYVVRVVASTTAGTSPTSAPSAPFVPSASTTPPRVNTVPSAPTNVRATSNTNRQSRVTWRAPASNGGSPLIAYTATGWPGAERCVVPARLTGCVVKGLVNGRVYVFTVTATNAVGTGPVSSPPAFAVPRSVPGPSGNARAIVRGRVVTFLWQVPIINGGARILGYNLYVGSVPRYASMVRLNVGLVPRGVDVWRLGRPGRYYVVVRAVNAIGAGWLSRVITVVVH